MNNNQILESIQEFSGREKRRGEKIRYVFPFSLTSASLSFAPAGRKKL